MGNPLESPVPSTDQQYTYNPQAALYVPVKPGAKKQDAGNNAAAKDFLPSKPAGTNVAAEEFLPSKPAGTNVAAEAFVPSKPANPSAPKSIKQPGSIGNKDTAKPANPSAPRSIKQSDSSRKEYAAKPANPSAPRSIKQSNSIRKQDAAEEFMPSNPSAPKNNKQPDSLRKESAAKEFVATKSADPSAPDNKRQSDSSRKEYAAKASFARQGLNLAQQYGESIAHNQEAAAKPKDTHTIEPLGVSNAVQKGPASSDKQVKATDSSRPTLAPTHAKYSRALLDHANPSTAVPTSAEIAAFLARVTVANAELHPFSSMPTQSLSAQLSQHAPLAQMTQHALSAQMTQHALAAQLSQLGQGPPLMPPPGTQPISDRLSGHARKSLRFPAAALPSANMTMPSGPTPYIRNTGSLQSAHMPRPQPHTVQPGRSLAPRQLADSLPFVFAIPPMPNRALPAKAPTQERATDSMVHAATAPQMHSTIPESYIPYILERGNSMQAPKSQTVKAKAKAAEGFKLVTNTTSTEPGVPLEQKGTSSNFKPATYVANKRCQTDKKPTVQHKGCQTEHVWMRDQGTQVDMSQLSDSPRTRDQETQVNLPPEEEIQAARDDKAQDEEAWDAEARHDSSQADSAAEGSAAQQPQLVDASVNVTKPEIKLVGDAEAAEMAVEHIKGFSSFAISCEGLGGGQDDSILLFQVCTGPECFIFDLTLPEVKAVVKRRIGLRQVLEKPDIEKVMHDSYVAVTAVFHQLKIRLSGVFDTMVAHDIDAALQEKATNGGYGFSSRIKPCLEDLADEFGLSFGYDRKAGYTRIQEYWTERPMQPNKLENACAGVDQLFILAQQLKQRIGSSGIAVTKCASIHHDQGG